MKYIMFTKPYCDGMCRLIPVIFPEVLTHSLMAESVAVSAELVGATIDSAGYYELVSGACYGESTSLSVASKPDRDSRAILMGGYGGDLIEC